MAGFNVIDFLLGPRSQAESGQSIMNRPYTTINPVAASPAEDQVRTESAVPPFFSPQDLDNFGRDTNEMRDAYLKFYRSEPTAKAAIKGKVNAIKCLDVSVKPADKPTPDEEDAAKFLYWAVASTPHGWDGLIGNMCGGAFLQGYSVNEIVLNTAGEQAGKKWEQHWSLKYCKSKNTNVLRLQLDAYRNVLGIVNSVMGVASYPRRKFILFTHDELFDDPFGASDLRAAYRACKLIDDAIWLWYMAEKVFGGPVVWGQYADKNRRRAMEVALDAFRSGGWITTDKEDNIQLLNMASSIGTDGKSRLIDKMREEVFLAVRGAFTPFMPGGSGAERGNTATNKSTTSDPDEEAIARAIGRRLSHDLVPAIVMPNYPPGTRMPTVILGGVNWAETKTQLDVIDLMENKLKRPVADGYIYEITKLPPGPMKPHMQPPAPPGAPGDPGAVDPALGPLPPDIAGEQQGGAPPANAPPPPTAQNAPSDKPTTQFSDIDPVAFADALDEIIKNAA